MLVWLSFSVFLAFGVEAMIGFGSLVLSLSLGALVMDLQSIMPLIVPLNLFLSGPIMFRYRQHIQWPVLGRLIIPWLFLGFGLALSVSAYVPAVWGKLLFALLVLWFSIRALLNLNAPQMSIGRQRAIVFGSGITQGLFATAGPLLVYALARSKLDKTEFRATLAVVWFSVNVTFTLWFLYFERLQSRVDEVLTLFPVMVCGALLGNWLHKKVDQQKFVPMVFSLLLIVGLILAGQAAFELIKSSIQN